MESKKTVNPTTTENLIDNTTTFNALLRMLANNPEVLVNAKAEAEEREAQEREENLRKTYGDDYDLVFDKEIGISTTATMTTISTTTTTADHVATSTDDNSGIGMNNTTGSIGSSPRRPGAIQLRTNVPRVAMIEIGENGICEVFSNGYAVYDNGNRKVVIWVPDCGTATYYFTGLKDNEKEYLAQSDEIAPDVMGEFPWYNAILIAGEDRIQYNMEHPKSKGTASDMDIDDVKPAASWAGATRFDGPEEAYLKKEAAEERRNALTEKQREAYELYYEQGYTQREIADVMGIAFQNVAKMLKRATDRIANL